MEPTNPTIKSDTAWQFQYLNKKDMVRRSNEAILLAALLGGGGGFG
jgi:hypothetical protein